MTETLIPAEKFASATWLIVAVGSSARCKTCSSPLVVYTDEEGKHAYVNPHAVTGCIEYLAQELALLKQAPLVVR